MQNSLGNPARGDAFYPREETLKAIYRALKTGASVYLSAPRRVGKTSILKRLEEFPKEDYYFIYVITESVDDKNQFFKVIFEELLASNAIKGSAKLSNAVKEFIATVGNKVKSIKDIELREGNEPDYYTLLVELFSNISKEHGRVIVMIDEFPQTIQNILDKEGKESAQQFIQKNRELRHHQNIQDKVNFIYTGSVSLVPMVEKVTSLTAINDLRTIPVDPLTVEHAKTFLIALLQNDDVTLPEELLVYIINKIRWLIPFHLQLIVQEIVDVFESDNSVLNTTSVDKAFDQVIHSRNKPQFEPYFSRLSKLFKGNEHVFVMEVLKHVAENDTIEYNILFDLSVKHGIEELKVVMVSLEDDGYLFEQERQYRYTSPILQLWCKKHICK